MAKPPYSALPSEAFWRTGVAEAGIFGLRDLWASKWKLPRNARFSTYGSCFAQHISRALLERKLGWFDAEPAPFRTPRALAPRFGYGVFSARTANIYTARQLLEWVRLSTEPEAVAEIELWPEGDGVRDSLRPMIEPQPMKSEAEARALLAGTASAFRRSYAEAEVFVFTLGLTEGWENAVTGQPYAMCPGTQAHVFDPDLHVFRNYQYPEIRGALELALEMMWDANPKLRVLFTVSPVPLTATASGLHVLPATTYSKSTLRAVAGDMAADDKRVDYFPSYEIIASPPARAAFFEPNMRSVSPYGVSLVMEHFFGGLDLSGTAMDRGDGDTADTADAAATAAQVQDEELVCEEMILERYNAR